MRFEKLPPIPQLINFGVSKTLNGIFPRLLFFLNGVPDLEKNIQEIDLMFSFYIKISQALFNKLKLWLIQLDTTLLCEKRWLLSLKSGVYFKFQNVYVAIYIYIWYNKLIDFKIT